MTILTVIIVCVTKEDGGEMYQFVPRFDFTILILHNSATYCYTESATIRLGGSQWGGGFYGYRLKFWLAQRSTMGKKIWL